MAIPANVTADLAALDAAVTAEQQAVATAATAATTLATAQTAKTNADTAVTAATGTANTAAQQLQTDIAAWVASGGTPPAMFRRP
jgi:hypothetical protein